MNISLLAIGMPSLSPVLLVIALLLGYFWVRQFVQLMLLDDDVFPGRFDKVLWGAAFIFIFPFAPFAFRAWKYARLAVQAAPGPVA